MVKKLSIYIVALLGILTTKSNAQDSIVYEKVYAPNIATVLLHPNGFEPTLPIIELGSEDKLLLSFDDMDNDNKFYSYTFIHCNADWVPSQLLFTQHTTGLPYDQINDWKFSLNTFKSYTNYRLVFPTENLVPKVSGNFIIKVYINDDPAQIVLTKRFMVVEKLVKTTQTIQRATDVVRRNTSHEIDFTIDIKGLNITNPLDNVKPVLLQNERWDNAIYGLKPIYLTNEKLTYDYYDRNVFNGGNEFRFFDLRNERLTNQSVRKITFEDDKQWHFFLYEEKNRLVNRYYVMDDINGKFFIRVDNGRDHYSEADYVWVHFELAADYPIDGDVYVLGMFTNWQLKPEFKLEFDDNLKAYVGKVQVKQGYYNYEYAVLKDGKVDDTYVEGNHYETEDVYHLMVYMRNFGDRADRLVAVDRFNSVAGK